MKEKWKTHPDFTDYAISSCGRVKRLTPKKGAVVGKILKPGQNKFGYRHVNIGGRSRFIHVLMLEAFVGPRPDGGEGRHDNDVKTDNTIDNLSWGSHSDNYADRVKNGGGNHGSRHGLSKLTEKQVKQIRKNYVRGVVTQKMLAEKFGVCSRNIGMIVRSERWKHV